MDMTFLRRAEQMLAQPEPAPVDYRALVAALAAQRDARVALTAASPQAQAERPRGCDEPMVELLLAGPGWRRALSAQRGCFSRAEAGRRVNGT